MYRFSSHSPWDQRYVCHCRILECLTEKNMGHVVPHGGKKKQQKKPKPPHSMTYLIISLAYPARSILT